MTRKKRIVIGFSDFRQIIEAGGYFVDKTLLIKEVIDNSHQVMLLPRPRRFGKTLNLSMLRYFFDVAEKDTAQLFEPFLIWKEAAYYTQQQGKYPVIHLSLKGGKATNFKKSEAGIFNILTSVYRNHAWLLQKDVLTESEQAEFQAILHKTADATTYEFCLKNLSEYLHRFYGEQVIILMDEYDAPIHTGYYHAYYEEIIALMKSLMGNTFKDNPHLHKGVITGILRIAKESIFSDLNNPGIFTILSYDFADKFGFTEAEVQQLLADFDLSAHYAKVKEWYDGYHFGESQHLYNPWSVINYVDKSREGFKTWWVNTSSDDLIKAQLTAKNATEVRNNINNLLEGKPIKKMIAENIVFSDFKRNKELIWSLLVFSGYLNPVKAPTGFAYYLSIPNYEIHTLFKKIILEWLQTEVKLSYDTLVAMVESLTNNRLQEFERHFKTIMGDTFSYFDVNTEPERVYQAYVLGLLGMLSDTYIIKSNKESGAGRYDILLLPRDITRYGIIMEIKQLDKTAGKARIQKQQQAALQQIATTQYYKELVAHKVKNRIELSLVFVGKEVFIKAYSTGSL